MLCVSRILRPVLACSALLALCGCSSIYDWFNSVGDHMPVIGQRCENWQCFTESGQEQSELNKQREQGSSTPAAANTAPADTVRKVPSEQPAAGPAATPAASSAASGDAPKLTPYDMTPEQLQELPPPQVPR